MFMSSISHSSFISIPPGSIMTSVESSHQFICVPFSLSSPRWYYNDTSLPSNSTSKADSFINVYETGNYTCSVNNSNYTLTLATGLYITAYISYYAISNFVF